MTIREATDADFNAIWPIFQEIVEKGDTYTYPTDTNKEEAKKIWMDTPNKTYVIEDEDHTILGTYYVKTNHTGAGSHVCNCGYMVASHARGKGLATTMCKDSQKKALLLGYKAMQFNFVASTNIPAIRLWSNLGFNRVGRLPQGFKHPVIGYIDALIMYKWLEE